VHVVPVLVLAVHLCLHQVGNTPLMMAVENDRVAVVKLLLERGADVQATSNVREFCPSDIGVYHNSGEPDTQSKSASIL
jgi:ankyrin repeat protein